ncbi:MULTISPECIES: UDP-N-acetylmuramoyl-L-alanine--D-glutamate ligase [Micrococcaceae]|uniref:UDP-N-acetylmuramoyl-L-alanine--D-glutamate ligase n=1 Tax=unclassified Kocuria TaxID=2649579 RepID=UPI001011A4C5|nr:MULTISPECIES: UDP-N-acetylmuramoyl-L-alanine--D-glutamate ligase [unclassified Kocuria]
MRSTQENPLVDNPRLESLTSWDSDWTGLRVVVAGIGVSGFAAADTLIELGARVVVVDGKDDEENRYKQQTLGIVGAAQIVLGEGAMQRLPDVDGERPDVVVTSPGLRPNLGILAQAAQEGVQIWGEVELAWRLRKREGRKTAEWVCITGTNGKTTTVGMTASILQAAGLKAIAVGNVGTPILDALRDPVEYDVLAVELSSYQLHWSYSVAPLASTVLNIAEDHIDWHGSYENYQADKARVFENTRVACVYNASVPLTEKMVEEADVQEGCRAISFTTDTPYLSQLGVVDGLLVDRAFIEERRSSAAELAGVQDTGELPTRHTVENALAAAALARAAGVEPVAVRDGLRSYEPGAHRIQPVANTHGVLWVNDSKATNPHAADASLSSFSPVIWIAGGLSKGVAYDDLVAKHAERLKAVVLIGTDTQSLTEALNRHAPNVTVLRAVEGTGVSRDDGRSIMAQAVRISHGLAKPDDTVLMAPAAASMDQFTSYAERGDAFIESVTELVERIQNDESEEGDHSS